MLLINISDINEKDLQEIVETIKASMNDWEFSTLAGFDFGEYEKAVSGLVDAVKKKQKEFVFQDLGDVEKIEETFFQFSWFGKTLSDRRVFDLLTQRLSDVMGVENRILKN